jgi:hypothetical protein
VGILVPPTLFSIGAAWRVLGALLALASACTSFRQVTPDASLSRPMLEVRFASPTLLVGRSNTGAEVVRRDVVRLTGRPLAVRGDSLVLEVWRSQGIGLFSRKSESPPFVAVVQASDPSVDVGERRLSHRRTLAAVLGPPVIAYMVVFIYCSTQRFCFWN